MKQKLLKTLVLLCALIVGSATSWADTSTVTASKISRTPATWTGSAGESWSVNVVGGALEQNVTSGYAQVGTKNSPSTSITISTSGIAGTITQIVVDAASYKGKGDINVTVGGSDFGTQSQSIPSWSSSTGGEVTFSGSASGAISITMTNGSGGRAMYIKSITVTYSAGGPVAVKGVSLDETALDLTVGSNATLTATVTPANATNKNVTWKSSNTSVATVNDEGVVTAIAAGTAIITVTTEDGSFTDDCEVTVIKALVPTVTLDFTSNDWGISEPPTKTVEANEFTKDGYTITLQGSTGNGYYFDTDNVMLGKLGASLTLPAFPFNVKKIKVYGTDGASGSVTFNIFVDETAVSTEVTSSKITHEFIINNAENQAAGNRYIIKVTNGNNMRISKIEVFGYVPATITSAGYATLFTPVALDFSGVDGLTAYTAVKDGNVVRLTPVSNVQANTGVVLEGAAKTYSIPAIATSTTAKGELTGNATAATAWDAESGYTYYVLASTGSGVEFRPVNAGEIAAGKAFLKVAGGSPVHAFNVVFGDETGISEVVRDGEKESAIFDLSGRRVAKPAKGLYIVNGKKILVK